MIHLLTLPLVALAALMFWMTPGNEAGAWVLGAVWVEGVCWLR